MNRTQLFELAVTTAKASLTETNPITLSKLAVDAAQANGVAAEDFVQFQQYINQARQSYGQMSRSPLQSEVIAARKAQLEKNAPVAPVMDATLKEAAKKK